MIDMKTILYSLTLSTAILFSAGCKKISDNSLFDNLLPAVSEPLPQVINRTLKETVGWEIDSLDKGFIHYNYSGLYQSFSAQENINVVEIDLNNPDYEIEIVYGTDSLSNVARNAGAIAGINGTYELDASFVKINGLVKSQVTIPPGHLRYWKHEGAFSFNNGSNYGIAYGTNNDYLASTSTNIISGAPMLISNNQPVGENFTGDVSGLNLNSLDYEDYRRHQGVRHPRTAVAITEDNKLLLVTVDGRWTQSAGMTAKEMTQFFKRYFAPKDALNIDGGGSTSMYLKDSNVSSTGIINYPTDDGVYDHYGQRRVSTFIIVKKRASSGSGSFDRGTGTEQDPYVIKTAAHLSNMASADWSKATTSPLYFKMEADVDMAGKSWTPLNNVDPYARHLHFNGNGHLIKNLTVRNVGYASLFGVLIGSCKNLGVVNATMESTSGAGIIAGYAGLKGPDKPTGIIENCFTSGTVSGTDAVGGIVGNIGKPNGAALSGVRNCYSTANVTATVATGNSRAGGIAGIVFEKGIVENCYATGTVTSNNSGAGGLLGWTDAAVRGLVSMNQSVVNKKAGKLGRISATMGSVGGVIAQGINCWGLSGMTLDNAGTPVNDAALITGTVTVANGTYDGETKTKSFLSDFSNYQNTLSWPSSGVNQVWATTMNNKGLPIFQWQFIRGDYNQ
jgi:exopolysaccharide biosynthesis protein